MGIDTYLRVVFWMGIVGITMTTLTIALAEYPRAPKQSLGADVVRLLLMIFFFSWVCYLRNVAT